AVRFMLLPRWNVYCAPTLNDHSGVPCSELPSRFAATPSCTGKPLSAIAPQKPKGPPTAAGSTNPNWRAVGSAALASTQFEPSEMSLMLVQAGSPLLGSRGSMLLKSLISVLRYAKFASISRSFTGLNTNSPSRPYLFASQFS